MARGIETVQNGGKAVDRSKNEDGTDHGSVSGWRANAHMQHCRESPPVNKSHQHPTLCSVRHLENPTLLGVNGSFLVQFLQLISKIIVIPNRHLDLRTGMISGINRVLGGGIPYCKICPVDSESRPDLGSEGPRVGIPQKLHKDA